ncbi:hypothetical protein FRB90_002440 [Tulasnella sp. 427]|nr:hypothetical protein FRB90_002440 [Tulasnella sp. 427]
MSTSDLETSDPMDDEIIRYDGWSDGGFDHYLSKVAHTDGDINAALAALEERDLCKRSSDSDSFEFSPLADTAFNNEIRPEEKLPEQLVDIFQVIQNLHLENGRTASCRLRHVEKIDRNGEARVGQGHSKVEAYLELQQTAMRPSERLAAMIGRPDVAVPLEYNSSRAPELVRMITIEDCTMTVWYFSRSHSAKSPEFDFARNPKILIRILLSFLFATEDELGYDPTIKRHLNPNKNNETCFIYKVLGGQGMPDRFFKTQGAIFEHRGLSVTGRATRVWKVVEAQSIDDNKACGPEMALKDVWLDEGARTEGENLRAIFAELKVVAAKLAKGVPLPGYVGFQGIGDPTAAKAAKVAEEPLRACLEAEGEKWRDYFLEPVCDCQGITSKATPEKSRPDDTLFDPRPTSLTPAGVSNPDPSRSTIAHPTELSPNKDETPPRSYRPKQQYRVVFKQVCTALHDVPQLGDVFIALEDCAMALQLMFVAGWVHRDISTGNIYARTDENGKGTPYFMAVEILKQALIYWEPPSTSIDYDSEDPPTTTAPSHVPVIHNFQHDVESVFWVILWTLLARLPSDASREKSAHFHSELSQILQHTGDCSSQRETLFTRPNELCHLLTTWLYPKLGRLIHGLDLFRAFLCSTYLSRKFEFGDLALYSLLYGHLRLVLRRCQKVLKESGPLPDLLPSRSMPETVVAEVNSPTTARIPPHGVISGPRNKRKQHTESRGGDDDEYIPPPPPKAARLNRMGNFQYDVESLFLDSPLPQASEASYDINDFSEEVSTIFRDS